ncbi:hypothetical protein FOYG_15198 [Fusarium oxysporum NRRL 32931]|uniref:Uncharacterized protein n=1 Tax=Fusarium oxysporum NRRL 32931 TaxID=660029 RepID=W9HFB2_FUSOX|nr:hypothetical protein FOYG_15198 [Fusarium oxysporum NRRL 32931]
MTISPYCVDIHLFEFTIMASAQEAKQIIQSLNEHGKLLGKHIKLSAKRLLYELLRYTNAETFAKGSATDEAPFVIFKIYPNKIVTDCNNGYLTKADVEAICQPVHDTQMKGANFKTIIAATKKVHIQSGNFSFEFQHNVFNVDSDVMRPIWVTTAETIPDNFTRITLDLHDQGSKEDIQSLREVIISHFENIQEECLLFLKNLQSMRVEFFDEDGKMHQSKHFRKHTVDEYRVSLKVSTVDEGKENNYTQLYHVTERSSDDLSTNLMLAFPLTDGWKVQADTKAKKLFNFIPLQTSPLGFHIHSNFDFEGGQQSIATKSAYNLSIQDQVATAFFQAILQFCEHPTLRYYWPLFLTPRVRGLNSFWSGLDADIQSWIAQNPILISQGVKDWRLISHLTLLSVDAQDNTGNPLLDDPINDPFISSKYPPEVANMLKEYGLATLNSNQFLKLLELHFNDPSLRLVTVCRTKEWHGALARLLSKLFVDEEQSERIRSLPLLQLRDGSLASAASGPVYFPTTGNIDIPENLHLRVISNSKSYELYPRALYQQLGVVQATVPQIRSLILDGFSCSKNLSLHDIKSYLRYLYLTHQSFNIENEQPYHAVKIMTLEMTIERPWRSIVYLPGMDNPYTPQKLFGLGLFGLSHSLNFLHPEILKDEPNQPSLFHPSWKKWLCDCLGIRERLSLFRPKTLAEQEPNGDISATDEIDVLSEEYKYVLKHRPDRFLGFTQYLWAFEGPQLLKNPTLVSEIQEFPARNLCVMDRSLNLQNTWVPLKELKEYAKHYMEYPDEFPFLKLKEEKDMDLAIATKWGFLTKAFSVKCKNDMDFLLEILESIKHSCHTMSPWQTAKVIELYIAISARLQCSIGDEKDRAQDFFNNSGILYIDDTGPTWTNLSSCLWTAPTGMASSYSLRRFYEEWVHDEQQMDSLYEMFHVEMGIQDAAVKDLVTELLLLRRIGCEDVSRITDIYKYLDKEMTALSEMKIAFDECGVILVKRDALSIWLTASECFWSEAETTQLNSSLKGCYPDLKAFFLEKLGINVSAYDKLLDSSTSVTDTKRNMLSLMDETNGLVPEFPAEPVLKAKVFPVRHPYGTGQPFKPDELCSVDTEFAIGDREHLKSLLGCYIKMLHFDLIEVRRLDPFFRWLSIEGRYLSRCAKEKLDTISTYESRRWDLDTKAYHIARVGATFNSYGSCNDALSLYQRLRTVQIVEVAFIFMKLEIVQNGQKIQSERTYHALAHISDCDDGLIIYVATDGNDQQLCFFSVLPRKLQEWLMENPRKRPNGASFEVVNALTSIFASDASVLDGILEDQGIVRVPFENQGAVRRKSKIRVRLPEVDKRDPYTLVIGRTGTILAGWHS